MAPSPATSAKVRHTSVNVQSSEAHTIREKSVSTTHVSRRSLSTGPAVMDILLNRSHTPKAPLDKLHPHTILPSHLESKYVLFYFLPIPSLYLRLSPPFKLSLTSCHSFIHITDLPHLSLFIRITHIFTLSHPITTLF